MRKIILLFLTFFLSIYGIDVLAEEVAGENGVDTIEKTDGKDGTDMPIASPGEADRKDILYNVSLPADSTAYLDPGNLSGRGQIFSDQYKIENYGNTDVSIKIKDVDIYCRSSESLYMFMEDKIADSTPLNSTPSNSRYAEDDLDDDLSVKRLHVEMVWKNEDEGTENTVHVSEDVSNACVLHLKAAEYDEDGEFVGLRDGGTGFFFFTGTLDPDPGLVWEDGEIMISFHYEIVSTEEEEPEEEPTETEAIEAMEETEPETVVEKPEKGTAGGPDGEAIPDNGEGKPEESTVGIAEEETAPDHVEEKPEEGTTGSEEDETAADNRAEKPEESTAGTTEEETDPGVTEEKPGDDTDMGEKKPEDDTDTGEKVGTSGEGPAGAIENTDTGEEDSQGVAEHEKGTEKTGTEGDLAATSNE